MKLTKEDVWGDYEKGTKGMIVARRDEKCPIWKDTIPHKSVTIICQPEQENEVTYWLDYVQGGNNISKRRVLKDGRIALRSNYMCW